MSVTINLTGIEKTANKSIDGTFAANSDTLYPSQKAAKTYVDAGLAGKQNSLGFTPENVANKSIDGTLAANSDTLYPSQKAVKTYADTKQSALGFTPENSANKDASGGYVGLTLFKINFKNVLNTFTSFFTNSNTAARTYTFQDRNGTIADDTDLALKANLASPAFTGNPTVPTQSSSDNSTRAASTAFVQAVTAPVTVGNKVFNYQNFY